jgi:hypothetical protein
MEFPLGFSTFIVLSMAGLLIASFFFGAAIAPPSLPCAVLSFALKEKVSYPGSAAYVESSNSYWSRQETTLEPLLHCHSILLG